MRTAAATASRCSFATRHGHLTDSTAAAVMRPQDVVTRLGPSERVAGLRGVFLTRPMKKFVPLEVLPASTAAPPLVLNLAFAPPHSISLRRFLALRHMFSSPAHLQVATEAGWYLVAPSSATPLCTDAAGLQAWCCRHHHRYVDDRAAAAPRLSTSPAGTALLSTLEAALDSGEELTQEQLQQLAAQERASLAAAQDVEDGAAADEDEDEDDGEDVRGGVVEGRIASAGRVPPAASSATVAPLRSRPPLITEAHLFEINDGVVWPLPPSDDLANRDYWRDHRQRMAVYESTGDADAAGQREALLVALRADPEVVRRAPSEQQLHAAADSLFQALKQKANVTLNVDAASGLLTLVPLRDLEAGDELLLHYGREWWTGRLLASLLLAVSDAEVAQVRWVEHLFHCATDRNEVFPVLMAAHEQRRRPRRGGGGGGSGHSTAAADADAADAAAAADAAGVTSAAPPGRVVLYNTVTRKRATDAAVLAFAVRRSCIDDRFMARLMAGDAPVFRLSEPDAEVPMRGLRRALLLALRGGPAATAEAGLGVTQQEEEDRRAATAASASGALAVTAAPVQSGAASLHKSAEADAGDDDDDDAVFSV
ncbi:hypothetical protein NESM_000410400 [Novymonas esmeraldas]|uniref:SET domain-containing protein n=1 Tax=Novymonas esmeraldas TaxID=1808958 RepID=A0AAW0EMK9_9TRYP